MVTRGSSPALIGRDSELERLRGALRAVCDAQRSVVLISGEAGIGKTRLLAELERSLREDPPSGRPTVVLAGGCVDVGGTLAYLPIIELLDATGRLHGEVGEAAMAARRALDGTAGAVGDPATPSAPGARAATYLRIRDLLAAAAAERDVVVVIDDLHWADRSTLGVIAFLARRLIGSGVLLVLAYRSDEIGRRHPLKPVLADIERHATLDHLRLEPLTSAEVRRQVASIVGGEPDRARTDRVVRLADGNPFHVEQLLSLDDDRQLPPSLREVLEARLDQLPDRGRRLVAHAAVIGREFDLTLLTPLLAGTGVNVEAALREAIEARILEAHESGRLRFRHALLREAAYAGLAGEERRQAHRRMAELLSDRSEAAARSPTVAADRARHWLAAGNPAEAFAAHLEAARSAAVATAWAETLAAYEGALELWDSVADAEVVAGSPRSMLLELATEIAWTEGDARRAVALNRRAQAEADVIADPVRLGQVIGRAAWLLDDVGDLEGMGDAARQAVELIPAAPPSEARAWALAALGQHASRQGRVRAAAALFEEANRTSEAAGAGPNVAALMGLTMARIELGEVERPREAIRQLHDLLPRVNDHLTWSLITTWTPWAWLAMGDHELAIESAERLMADARGRALERGVGMWCLAPRAIGEFWLGRWDAADATIARQNDYVWGVDAAIHLRCVEAQVSAGRGDATHARALVDDAIEIARTGFPGRIVAARAAAAWVELLDDRPAAALSHIGEAWAIARSWEGIDTRSLLLWLGCWAAVDAAPRDEPARRLAAELTAAATAALEEVGGGGATNGPRLVLELAAAEASRPGTEAAWRALGDTFERAGDLPRACLARQRQAEAHLHARGDRATAAQALEAAIALADLMGAARLRERALGVARAARLKVADDAPADLPDAELAWGLSRRELEVLALLANGRTNRQIAEALFISDKTASVHVTHIMSKMGVERRTEAALLAVRSGIGAHESQMRESAPPK